MSEKEKQSTPPPLLLMGASGGSNWNSPQGASLFMPVPQTDSPLFNSDDGGEEDSFVGQSNIPSAPLNYFQPTSTVAADPFANVGHNPIPTSMTALPPVSESRAPPTAVVPPVGHTLPSTVPPPSALPSFGTMPLVGPGGGGGAGLSGVGIGGASGLPPTLPSVKSPAASGSSSNMFRQTGAPKYAPPPSGTYAPTTTATPPQPIHNPTQNFMPPPFSDGKPLPPPPQARPSDVGIPSSYVTQGSHQPPAPIEQYIPVQHHWFFSVHEGMRTSWKAFSYADSNKLEQSIQTGMDASTVVSTDGGRYDVTVASRTRSSVYYEEADSRVRRCSWFFKIDGETKFNPYEEDFAERLEESYKQTLETGEWHKRLEFPGGDSIVIHNPGVIVHFTASAQPDEWGTTSSDTTRPRVVRRGVADINEDIPPGEPTVVDHVVFVVHGIGVTCDLRFRSIVECVNDMRSYSLQMGESHFKVHQDAGRVGRVEFLPVRWHAALHGDATGVDRRLKAITLGSIGKLRHFTNDTLLDILFYSSPAYAQQIANTVAEELNRLQALFLRRNPQFQGSFSLCGHSLGSLILFDLLLHQEDPEEAELDGVDGTNGSVAPLAENNKMNGVIDKPSTGESTPVADTSMSSSVVGDEEEETLTIEGVLAKLSLTDYAETFAKEQVDVETLTMCEDGDLKEMGIPLGPRKKLQGFVKLQKHKQKKLKRQSSASKKRKEEVLEERRKRQLEERLAAEAARQQTNTQPLNQSSCQPDMCQPQPNAHDPLLRSASNTCVSYVQGAAGIGIPFVQYPKLDFRPAHFFALGSPIAMFLTVRGVDMLGDDFKFPTCPAFFNIFHPFDPVAYRLEPMIVNAFPPKPVLMPHHKGRKRLHLELKESLSRMGADIKQRIIDSVRSTWATLHSFAQAHRTEAAMEETVDSALQQLSEEEERAETESLASSMQEDDILVGNINQGRRIDYVLQEKPIESFNDYLFALASHLCYWESEDTVLLILKEVYSLRGIHPIKPGSQPPTAASLGPPPTSPLSSMNMPPANKRPYPSAHTNYMSSSTPGLSGPGAMTSQFPVSQMSTPTPYFAGARPPSGNPYSANSAHALTGQMAPAPGGMTGPPPLSGFMRKS